MARPAGPWFGWLSLGLLVAAANGADLSGGSVPPPNGPKVPVALAWGPDGKLQVALRDARQVAVVDPGTWGVISRSDLPIRPASLAFADDEKTRLVGGMDGELVVLDPEGKVARSLVVGKGATHLVPLPDGRVLVASTWTSAVHLVDWRAGAVVAEHPLPFAPGSMVRRPDGRVIVADAFGGKVADLVPGQVGTERVRSIDGVNLHALAISGDGKELLVAHMIQFDTVPISTANIDWGLVISSRLSAIRLSAFDSGSNDGARLPSRRVALDGSSHGAADPSAMAISRDGTQVVMALAGSHQVLKCDRTLGSPTSETADLLPLGHSQRLEVVEVGRTPVAILIDPTGRWVVTADAMSDTLSVLPIDGLEPVKTVALSSGSIVRTPAQRGEAWFRDGRRSMDRWMSCASCHTSGHTNGLNYDTQGDGGTGAAKNTPSLLGVGQTAPYTWTGGFSKLGDQIHQSIMTSLRGPRVEVSVVDELAAYLETLSPPPAPPSRDDAATHRGEAVFRARRCDTCHKPPFYTIDGVRDVGLDDGVGGHERFNPPSLRGVRWSAPYFHDGRAASLDQVLGIHPSDPSDLPWKSSERVDLIRFLESL